MNPSPQLTQVRLADTAHQPRGPDRPIRRRKCDKNPAFMRAAVGFRSALRQRGGARGEGGAPPLRAGQVSSSGSVAIALVVRIAPAMQTDLQCERQPVGGSMIG